MYWCVRGALRSSVYLLIARKSEKPITLMAAVDVYRTAPSSTGGHEVTANDTEELQLSQEDMDVASLSANAVPQSVIPSSVATTLSAPAYVSTTAGGERNQHHQVDASGGTESGVLITEPVLGVRMLMSSRVSE